MSVRPEKWDGGAEVVVFPELKTIDDAPVGVRRNLNEIVAADTLASQTQKWREAGWDGLGRRGTWRGFESLEAQI